MFISDFAIRKPIVTVTVMIALVTFGLIALANLKTDEFPDIQQPVVGITIPYPGAAPETVEREIIDPLEDAIFAINGIDARKTTASATDGLAIFTVFFDYSKDIQQAEQDIRDAISTKRADLPTEMKEPVLSRFDPSDLPILSLALTSTTLSAARLSVLADPLITGELRSVQGVADVTVVGQLKPELTVQLDPTKLAAAGIAATQVVAALQAQNLTAPVGRVNAPLEEQNIRIQGRLAHPSDFEGVVIATRGGKAIRLGEVAKVFAGHEEQRTLALFNDREAVGIDVLKAKGYSTTAVADEIVKRMNALQKRLPTGAKVEIVKNSGTRVAQSVVNVEEALLEGALLTVLVVFLFLNSWRSTVITGLALPVSVLAAFVSVWIFGFTLNTMSLLGLTLAIGILIDDAIVVRENIVRHVQMGKDHLTAAHEGTNEIGLAVAATTFSIVCVFAPVAFMSGVAGQWFKPFALTIACAVLVSLFVSFSLDPMLSAYWFDPQLEAGARRGLVGRALNRFNHGFDRVADGYRGVIGWALDHRWLMVFIGLAAFLGAIALQVLIGGAGFAPTSDRSELSFYLETPPGSSLEYTRRKVEAATALARAYPGVEYSYTTIGVPLPMRSPGVDQASVYVHLTPRKTRHQSQEEIGRVLREQLGRIGGATVSVFTSGFGGGQKQIQVELRGPDLERLNALAEEVKAQVKQVRGAVDVELSTRGQKPELVVDVRRGLAGTLGVTAGEIAQSLRVAFAGVESGDWVDPTGETRKVVVRLAPEARVHSNDLASLPLMLGPPGGGNPGSVLPLGQVAQITRKPGPAQISHLNREKVINVEANTEGSSLSQVVSAIEARLRNVDVPNGYTVGFGGEAESQREVFGSIFTALIVAVMLMYLILVIQFGSFIDPLAILISLPLSLIGVVLSLLIVGDTLNIMSLIGVILLMGIVAKNAILLIDFAKWAREGGMPLRQALIEAGRIRLRPIVMTTVALIAGMLPVAIGLGEGGDFRAPLGRAVIGGTITSTLLTLLVIPTIYEILDGFRTRSTGALKRVFGAKRGPGKSGHGPPVQQP